MFKKVFSIALALVMALSLFPMAAQAEDETVYTVTLSPGDGTGQDIVYRSDQGEIAADFHSAGYGQFYYENGGGLGFCFDYQSCPAGWTAPEGYVFDCFVDSEGRGAVHLNFLTKYNTVFTARWRLAGDPHVNVTFSTTLDLNAFDENGFLPLTVTFLDLDFGQNTNDNPTFIITFIRGEFTNHEEGDREIDLKVYNSDHSNDGSSLSFTVTCEQSVEIALHADPEMLQATPQLIYTGNLEYNISWIKVGKNKIENYQIPMRLMPLNVLTVNSGSGSGSYAAGGRITVTADVPAAGYRFKEWSGADGLTFTEGSATSTTATFIMPTLSVTLTATYEDLYDVTVVTGKGNYSGAATSDYMITDIAVPTGVKVTPTGESELKVSWNAQPEATQFNIYRWNGTEYKYIGTTFATDANPTQFVNSGLTVGTSYFYKVVSVYKGNGKTLVSEFSDAASAMALGTPAIPTGVTVKPTATKELTVSWNAVAGATQYNVYCYNGSYYKYIGTTFATSTKPTQYVNSGLSVGTEYSYKVLAACKGNGLTFVGEFSNAASATALNGPAVPTGLTVKATAEKTLTVSWNAQADATQFNVYRRAGSTGNYRYIGTTFATDANPTQFVNFGLTIGTSYYYKVVSVYKDDGKTLVSEFPDAVSAMALGTPAIPTGVTVKPTATKELTVSWNAIAGATQYNVYRYNGSYYKFIGTTFASSTKPTQYVNSGLSVGTEYSYKVLAACKGDGLTFVSEFSNASSATVLNGPAIPTGLIVKATADKTLTVSWNAQADATQFNVYRRTGSTGNYRYIGTTFATDNNPTQYVDNMSLTSGQYYYYMVVAVIKKEDLTLVSAYSVPANAKAVGTPAVPTGVNVTHTAEKTLTISWDAQDGATQFNIYRFNAAKNDYFYKGTTFATDANPTQYKDTNLNAGAVYYYKVVAVYKDANMTLVSEKSVEVSFHIVDIVIRPEIEWWTNLAVNSSGDQVSVNKNFRTSQPIPVFKGDRVFFHGYFMKDLSVVSYSYDRHDAYGHYGVPTYEPIVIAKKSGWGDVACVSDRDGYIIVTSKVYNLSQYSEPEEITLTIMRSKEEQERINTSILTQATYYRDETHYYNEYNDFVPNLANKKQNSILIYEGDTKSSSDYLVNAVAYPNGTIIGCRDGGDVVRIEPDGTETVLLTIYGVHDWRLCYMDSSFNVYVSPHSGTFSPYMNDLDRGLYRLKYGSDSFEKVISLCDSSIGLIPKWQTATEYEQGNYVFYRSVFYRCKKSHISNNLFDVSVWDEVFEWTAGTSYSQGALVKYQNDYYIARTDHISGSMFDESKWRPATECMMNDDTIWTMCEDAAGNLYAGVYSHTVRANPAIYKSVDGGLTWRYTYNFITSGLLPMDSYGGKAFHVHCVAFNDYNLALYAAVGGCNTLVKSTDGGMTWTDLKVRPYYGQATALLGVPDGLLIGSDGNYSCGISKLMADDKTMKSCGRTCPGFVFGLRKSDLTGWIYAFTRTDYAVASSSQCPPPEAKNDPEILNDWLTTYSGTFWESVWRDYNSWASIYYPEDAIYPSHAVIMVSKDNGNSWEVIRYEDVNHNRANMCGYITIGYFRNGEILIGRALSVDGTDNAKCFVKPLILSEGKKRITQNGYDLAYEIFIKTNSTQIVPF